jgi:predicted ArsR family transcriptional regulator
MVERLNELHYQARWEASAAGPRLILGHCPYAMIVSDHQQLCQMDLYLLETMLDSVVVQSAKLQLNDKGLPSCTFLMTRPYEHQEPFLGIT